MPFQLLVSTIEDAKVVFRVPLLQYGFKGASRGDADIFIALMGCVIELDL